MSESSFWTGERVTAARELWHEGKSYSQIAIPLGATRSSVAGLLKRQGLRREPVIKVKPRSKAAKAKHATGSGHILQIGVVGSGAGQRIAIRSRAAAPDAARAAPFKPLGGVQPVGLMDLTFSSCRWPVATDSLSQMYCGDKTAPTRCYCATHTAMAYTGKPEVKV